MDIHYAIITPTLSEDFNSRPPSSWLLLLLLLLLLRGSPFRGPLAAARKIEVQPAERKKKEGARAGSRFNTFDQTEQHKGLNNHEYS
jgi:hypothetical protein